MKIVKKTVLSATIVILTITGCSYMATTTNNPATDIYSNNPDRIAGRWAVYVDADEMAGRFKVSGLSCYAHSYPVDARNTFAISVEQTLRSIMDNLETIYTPILPEEKRENFDGVIRIEVEELEVDLFLQGLFSLKADVEITVTVTVDGIQDRRMRTTIEGDGDHKAGVGVFCGGGATAIGKAVDAAIKETLERLGEHLSNSPVLGG